MYYKQSDYFNYINSLFRKIFLFKFKFKYLLVLLLENQIFYINLFYLFFCFNYTINVYQFNPLVNF